MKIEDGKSEEQLISECAKENLLKMGYSIKDILRNNIEEKDLVNSIKSCCINGTLCVPKMEVVKNLVFTTEAQKLMKRLLKEQISEEYYTYLPEEESEVYEKRLEKENEFEQLQDEIEEIKKQLYSTKERNIQLRLGEELEELVKEEVKVEEELRKLEKEEHEKMTEVKRQILVERGFVIFIDKDGKEYSISPITRGTPSSTILMREPMYRKGEKEKVAVGSFHIHPDGVLFPSGQDLSQKEKVIFISGIIGKKRVINAFFKKPEITWEEIYKKEFEGKLRKRILSYPFKIMKIVVPREEWEEEDFKFLWEENNFFKIRDLSYTERDKLWEKEKGLFMEENQESEEQLDLFNKEDLEKINDEGKEIYGKYFNITTLEL